MDAKNAVVFVNDAPHFELAANELIFRDEQHDARKPIYFHLRPYLTRDMKAALTELKERSRPTGNNRVVVESADMLVLRLVFDKTFIRMSNVRLKGGVEATIEQQREWLNRNPGLKGRIVNDAFTAILTGDDTVVQAPPESNDQDESALEIVLDEVESKIVNRYRLYSPEKQQTVTIRLTHVFKKESESDRLSYNRAANRREINRTNGETARDINYDAIEQLYNRLISRLDGALINGERCTEENKNAWVSTVPFWHKVVTIDQLFDESVLKNV